MPSSPSDPAPPAKSPFAHRAPRVIEPLVAATSEPASEPAFELATKKKRSVLPAVGAITVALVVAAVITILSAKPDERVAAAVSREHTPAKAPAAPVVRAAEPVTENRIPNPPAAKAAVRPPEAGLVFRTAKVGLAFAYAPAGTYAEGSPEGESGRSPDETRRKVTLTRGFNLGITCVTQAQWDVVMGRGNAAAKLAREKRVFTGPDLPMVDVTWAEAESFCDRLSEIEGVKFRLPTEAEWEYACHAGGDSPYCGGRAFLKPGDAVFDDGTVRAPEAPRDVSSPSAPVNAWGLRDMHGNVWQWCADRYAVRTATNVVDPVETLGSDETTGRVVRGGSWNDPASSARSAKRWQYPPVVAVNYIGFRILMVPPGSPSE